MDTEEIIQDRLQREGFHIENCCFSKDKIDELIPIIKQFKKEDDIFAIRQFFEVVPLAKEVIFNEDFIAFLKQHLGKGYFLIKAIYFDKPPTANWIVPWHQDLTIVTNQKVKTTGFSKWRIKNGLHYVHPPVKILENIITIRIHLDDCTQFNGALKVVPASHKNGIDKKLAITQEKAFICEVKRGGVLIMKPLLFHASERRTNNLNRRVIHLEFTSEVLPPLLTYRERINFS